MTKNFMITCNVNGIKLIREEGTEKIEAVQIQNIIFKDNGEMVRNTVKLNKEITEKEASELKGKVIELLDVKEFVQKDGFTRTYSAEDYKIKEGVELTLFKIDRSCVIKLDNYYVKRIKDKKNNTEKDVLYIQELLEIEDEVKLITIKLNEISNDTNTNKTLKDLKGKNVLVKEFKESKIENKDTKMKKTYYSTTVLPTLSK